MTKNQTIKNLRENLGYSIKYVAQQTKIPENAIYKYEDGSILPSVERKMILAKFFKVKVSDLIFPKDVIETTAQANEIPQWKEMFEEFKSMVDELRKEINQVKNTTNDLQGSMIKVMGKFSDSLKADNVFPFHPNQQSEKSVIGWY
jgi:predicted transcriptional regulator